MLSSQEMDQPATRACYDMNNTNNIKWRVNGSNKLQTTAVCTAKFE